MYFIVVASWSALEAQPFSIRKLTELRTYQRFPNRIMLSYSYLPLGASHGFTNAPSIAADGMGSSVAFGPGKSKYNLRVI